MKSTPVSRGGSGGGNGNVDDESLQLIRGGDVPLAPSLSSPPLGRKRIAGSSQQQSSKRSLRGKEILDPYLGIAERESAEIMSMSMPPKPWCFDLPDKERCTRLDGCIYNYREYNMCCCGGARPDRTWAPLPTDEGSIGSGPFDSGPAPIGSSSSSSSSSGGGSFFFLIFFSIFIVVVGVCAFMPKSSSGRSGGRRRGGSGHVVSGPPHAHVDSGGGNWGWGGGGGGDGGGGGGGGCGSGGGGGGGGKQRYYAAFLFDPSILCLISCYDMLIVFVFLHPDRSNNRRLWRWRIKQEN